MTPDSRGNHSLRKAKCCRIDATERSVAVLYHCFFVLVPLSAGNWNNGSNAGVFYRNLNNNRGNSNNNYAACVAAYLSCLMSR